MLYKFYKELNILHYYFVKRYIIHIVIYIFYQFINNYFIFDHILFVYVINYSIYYTR